MHQPFTYQSKVYRLQDAELVLPLVLASINPASVIDIGCGTGTWLATCKKWGVKQILGYDNSQWKESEWAIDSDCYEQADLSKHMDFPFRADLCLSLEVGEHINSQYAEKFAENLTRASDVILFSAAIPGQGGQFHVNEQWPSYWMIIFNRLGYECYDVIRPLIWHNPNIHYWYRQNIFLYIKKGSHNPFPFPPGQPISAVHPELFEELMERNKQLSEQIKAISWHPTLQTGIKIFFKSLYCLLFGRKAK